MKNAHRMLATFAREMAKLRQENLRKEREEQNKRTAMLMVGKRLPIKL